MLVYGRLVLFQLPVKVESVRKVLQRKRRRVGAIDTEHAFRRRMAPATRLGEGADGHDPARAGRICASLPAVQMDESRTETAWDAAR